MITRRSVFLIPILIILVISVILIAQKTRKEVKEPVAPLKEKELIVEKKVVEKVAKIAIVVDDLGYSLNNLGQIYNIERPITFSILPDLAYSKRIAEEAAKKGYQIILHLPLEPHDKDAPLEADTIKTDMAPTEVLEKLNKAIDSVPTLKGVSNHMGSKATEDPVFMHIIFSELKKRGLYFLDSLVTGKSICENISKELGVGFARRNVYLDNIGEADYIRNQYKLLIDDAKRKGFSIGIGHDRPLTIRILSEEMPKSEEEGIEFVFVSELVK